MKTFLLKLTTITLCVITLFGCQVDDTSLENQLRDKSETFVISTPATPRTHLGEKVEGIYPVYWSEGDCIAVNGIKSQEAQIDDENKSVASFSVNGSYVSPYCITYPYCTTTTADAPKVVFQTEQSYVENSFAAESAPMYGYATSSNNTIQLKHLAGVLRFPITTKLGNIVLERVVITSETAKIAGEFSIDCENGTLLPSSSTSNTITYTLPANYVLSADKESVFYITLPAVSSGACSVEFIESSGEKMVAKIKNQNIKSGVVYEFSTLEYRRGVVGVLPSMGAEYDQLDFDYVVYGYVKDSNGNPIKDVPVSDGFNIVTTNQEGYYTMKVSSDTWYIYISLPAEYEVPINEFGQPCFYKKYIEYIHQYDFTLTPLPGGKETTFALFAIGDPQVSNAGVKLPEFNNYAVPGLKKHATEVTNSGIPCYGITLGDIISNNTGSSDEYLRDDMRNGFAVSKTGFPIFQVMGNHDYTYCNEEKPLVVDGRSSTLNLKAQRNHEDMFGPVNYSFNRGDFHIIGMKDIVYQSATVGGSYLYGFTEDQYQWLQQDLALVPKDKAVVLCVHIQIFNRTARYCREVKDLLNEFNEAHILSGHTHQTRNYEHSVEGETTTKIYEHNAGALCGAWWATRICSDGVPNGYQVFIGGNDENGGGKFVDWYFMGYYEGTNSRNNQMRLYRGDAITGAAPPENAEDNPYGIKGYYQFNFGENVILANVYNADSKWVMKVYEDDEYTGNMEKVTYNSPSYSTVIGDSTFESPRHYPDGVETSHDMYVAGLYTGILGRYDTSSNTPPWWGKCRKLYKYTLTNPKNRENIKDVEIKVVAIDRFGNEYPETKITDGTDYSLTDIPR